MSLPSELVWLVYICVSVGWGRLCSASHDLVWNAALMLMVYPRNHITGALLWPELWPSVKSGFLVLREAVCVPFCILPVSVLGEGASSDKIWQSVFGQKVGVMLRALSCVYLEVVAADRGTLFSFVLCARVGASEWCLSTFSQAEWWLCVEVWTLGLQNLKPIPK